MRPPDAAVPPVADDVGRRQRAGGGEGRASARSTSSTPTRPRRSSGPRRSSASTSPPAPQREAIAAAMAGVQMGRGFGDTLDRLIRNGVGVHHAGMLPRYRRLVERLAGAGPAAGDLRHRHARRRRQHPDPHRADDGADEVRRQPRPAASRVREFHQLAGRAGRPGFDPDGHVWVQAPDHVIENARALSRAGDDPKARRKATKAKAARGLRRTTTRRRWSGSSTARPSR